jgi:predicted NBD/HSP70 family sugar kinase
LRIGVDLGGTKVSIVVLDDSDQVRYQARRSTPQGDYAATLDLVAALIAEAEREAGPARSIGIGTPGSPDPDTGLMRNANSVCLNGMPLKPDIEARLGRPVVVANDANCFALSEATDGAGRGAPVVFGVILGTGVGGGIVVDGTLLGGANHIGGEWGHNPLPDPDPEDLPAPPCYCGRQGCIETYLSGPGLALRHRAAGGRDCPPAEIAAAAARGEETAGRVFARYLENLAKSLAGVINILDPHAIVLGGGLSNLAVLYEEVPRRWARHVFSGSVRTLLLRHQHGDDSGVRGAARLG